MQEQWQQPPPPPPGYSSTPGGLGGGLGGGTGVFWARFAGGDGRLQLCLSCDEGDGEALLQFASNLAMGILGADASSALHEDDVEDPTVAAACAARGWPQDLARRVLAMSGPFAGMSGVGLGANVKKRRRTCRLALAIFVCAEFPPKLQEFASHNYPPLLYQLVDDARATKAEVVRQMVLDASAGAASAASAAQPPPPPPSQGMPPMAPPAAAPVGQPPPPPPHFGYVPQQGMPPPPYQPAPPAQQMLQPAPQLRADLLAFASLHGVPLECLSDPWMELKPFGGGPSLWPYCTLCSTWSDLAHVGSKRHVSGLQSYGPPPRQQPPQLAFPWVSGPAAAAVAPAAAAAPAHAQNGYGPPPQVPQANSPLPPPVVLPYQQQQQQLPPQLTPPQGLQQMLAPLVQAQAAPARRQPDPNGPRAPPPPSVDAVIAWGLKMKRAEDPEWSKQKWHWAKADPAPAGRERTSEEEDFEYC